MFIPFVSSFGFVLLGYLAGSLPFALWITRLFKGVDVRDSGSGHATTTNTFRQVGLLPGLMVLLLDIGKGFTPTYLAIRFGGYVWIAALVAGMVVVGHCWPLFAQFRGGMGLAPAGGCILAASPLGFTIAVGILVALTLILRHSARASVIAGLLLPPVLWLLDFDLKVVYVAAAVGLVIAIRFLRDWQREYRELWLDR
jgi:glycerol-3-phosphate acyltransferase PlsY